MLPKKLKYGNEGFREIEAFLNENKREGYTLSLYNIFEESTAEIICPFEEMLSAIMTATNLEHDFPAWIGINEMSDSYVVGLNFTRGNLETPGIYEYKNGRFLRKHFGNEA